MLKKYQAYAYYIAATALMVATTPVKVLAITNDELSDNLIPIITTDEAGINILTRSAVVVINVILLIAGILAVIYLIYSGILYVTAGGETGKAEKGRTGIVNAIIGLVIIAASYLLVRFVGGTINGANDLKSENAPWGI